MRTQLVVTVLCSTVLLGFSASTARAEEVGRMTIPFSFVVSGRTLPPGRYDVRTDDGDPMIVRIDAINNTRAHAIVTTIPEYGQAPSGDKPALTFIRDGDQYRLSTVWETRNYGRDITR